jgi:acyl-CoA hydrolase
VPFVVCYFNNILYNIFINIVINLVNNNKNIIIYYIKLLGKKMENHKLVLPEHLNHYGYLFGGNLLKWVDEYAWIAVSLDYPKSKFVTVGFDNVEFKKSVRQGSILKFNIEKEKIGNTSVKYLVKVFRSNLGNNKEEIIFSTCITFVCVNDQGKKISIP